MIGGKGGWADRITFLATGAIGAVALLASSGKLELPFVKKTPPPLVYEFAYLKNDAPVTISFEQCTDGADNWVPKKMAPGVSETFTQTSPQKGIRIRFFTKPDRKGELRVEDLHSIAKKGRAPNEFEEATVRGNRFYFELGEFHLSSFPRN